MRDLKVASVCMRSEFGGIADNVKKMGTFVREAASAGVDMICFPELSITGYSIREDLQSFTESIPGSTTDHLVNMAKENSIVILAGMLEKGKAKKPYISQVIAGPAGIIGVYRKTHLSPLERNVYKAGREIKTFSYNDITFGIQLCYESHFPEMSAVMSLQGADVIFFPYASPNKNPEDKRESWLRTLPARAFDNGVFVVACNQAGENGRGLYFPGVLVILGPTGKILNQYTGNEEKMIIGELHSKDLNRVRSDKMQAFIKYRRPELYGEISGKHKDKV